MRRVVITGVGSINALGSGVPAFEAGLRAGRCGIGRLRAFDCSGYRSDVAGEVSDLTLPEWLPPAAWRHASRSDRLALIAAHEALVDSGLHAPAASISELGASSAVIVGATTGGMYDSEEYRRRSLQGQPLRQHTKMLSLPVSSSGDLLAQVFGCDGARLTISTACSSGANALGVAAGWIRSGRADVVLCGGTDSLCRMTFSGFNALQALDRQPCRPFDRERAGLSLGEGAAMFTFEARDCALARGARVLAEFLGYGISADAYHITQGRPDGAGTQLAMQRAIEDSGRGVEEVDYVNAHGTGTPLNDVLETQALKAVFGARAYRIPVSSTKSMIGHCLGAAGAIEALACVLALRGGFVPPTLGLETPDPECDLDYVPTAARNHGVGVVMSNSYGFGGNNTSIVLGAADG